MYYVKKTLLDVETWDIYKYWKTGACPLDRHIEASMLLPSACY